MAPTSDLDSSELQLRYGTNFEEGIVRVFQEDTTISVRVAARRFVMSQWKARATLNKEKLHPYHYTPVQDLLEEDPLRRIGFCRFMLNADMEDSTFLSRILWTDESNFNREGITNYHNAHYYRNYQRRFSANVWCGVINDQIIKPYFLPDILNGQRYNDFPISHLPLLRKNVPLNIRQTLIFQH
ncbi:hypothetical protein YQE_09945, partial [Dendroctonus ponderosae]